MFRRFSVLIVLAMLALPSAAPAADKSIQELQRDVALLQQMVTDLQKSQAQKFTELLPIVQQALESANRANTAIAGIQTSLQQSLKVQEEKVVTPVVGLSTRMDNLTSELRTTEQNVTDLSGQLSKIMASLDDLKNLVKVIQTPVAPPPPVLDAGSDTPPNAGRPTAVAPDSGGQVPAPATATAAPTMSQVETYQHALSDYQGGNYEFALQEFADYLKFFKTGPFASNAQYYIGMIHYAKGDYETAVKDFDMVLENYPPKANKNPEARYAKGLSLVKLRRPTDAAQEFKDLIRLWPHDPLVSQACGQIKDLGMNCPAPAVSPAGKKSGKKD